MVRNLEKNIKVRYSVVPKIKGQENIVVIIDLSGNVHKGSSQQHKLYQE